MDRQAILRLSLIAFLALSAPLPSKGIAGKLEVAEFGTTVDGQAIESYRLVNRRGMEAVVINYGATLVSLRVPDRYGKTADVVLGYDDLNGYEQGKSFFGGTIGRYANRIANGRFTLNGTVFHLSKNDGPNTLHGGDRGFNKRVWKAVDRSTALAQILELSYTSRDGEEGFPGNLEATVTYTLPLNSNELRLEYSAKTDKETVVNLTNHSYFNLSGDPTQEITNHELQLNASRFTPINAALIPTGELQSVSGTPFDFRKLTVIGARIDAANEQLKSGKGYDHNWVLDRTSRPELQLAARLFEPKSGRMLEILTTEPGIQFYSGNALDGTVRGKKGELYRYRTGLCLETQHFPDSPNHPNFPSTTLKPGQTYRSETVWRFSASK